MLDERTQTPSTPLVNLAVWFSEHPGWQGLRPGTIELSLARNLADNKILDRHPVVPNTFAWRFSR